LKNQKSDILDVFSLHERFTQCITDGSGVKGLLRELSSYTSMSTAFEGSGITALLTNSPEAERLLASAEENEGWTGFRISQPVTASGNTLGILSLLSGGRPPGFDDDVMKIVLKLASDFLAIQLTMDKRIAEIELGLTGNFIEDLISGNYLSEESVLGKAKALGFVFTQPRRVLVSALQNAGQAAKMLKRGEEEFWAELVKKVQSILNHGSDGLAAYRDGEIIILLGQNTQEDDFDHVDNLAEQIVRETEQDFMLKMYIGIGDLCIDPQDYRNSYITAKKALEIGEFMLTEGRVRSFERFGAHALFLSTLRPEYLKQYAKNRLHKLIDHDTAHKTELVKTLQEFLYLRNNIEGTVKSLNLSVSGLKYRLKQIERVLGAELREYKVCFD
jgi:sugar diacid utilization regulator